jgi:hypothetical protein
MESLKVPNGVAAVSHGTHTFEADSDGFINTKDAPPEVVQRLIKDAGCRIPTDADYAAADANAIAEEVKHDTVQTKASLRAALDQLGVTYDGRATIKGLARMLDEARAKSTAEAKAATPAAQTTAEPPAQKAATKPEAEKPAAEPKTETPPPAKTETTGDAKTETKPEGDKAQEQPPETADKTPADQAKA